MRLELMPEPVGNSHVLRTAPIVLDEPGHFPLREADERITAVYRELGRSVARQSEERAPIRLDRRNGCGLAIGAEQRRAVWTALDVICEAESATEVRFAGIRVADRHSAEAGFNRVFVIGIGEVIDGLQIIVGVAA